MQLCKACNGNSDCSILLTMISIVVLKHKCELQELDLDDMKIIFKPDIGNFQLCAHDLEDLFNKYLAYN